MEGTFISNKYQKLNDKYSYIVESKSEVENLKATKSDYIKYLHCNGCYRKCSLTNAYCGKGKNTKVKFQ